MTDATLMTGDAGRPAVRLECHLPDPPPVVWQALTQREQLRSWFPCDVVVSGGRWAAGAPITFPVPPEVIDMTLTGRVLEVDEPKLLAFTWTGWPGSPRPRTPGSRATRRTPPPSSPCWARRRVLRRVTRQNRPGGDR